MNFSTFLSRRWSPVAGALLPLPVAAVAIAGSWSPWPTVFALAAVVVVAAFVLGRAAGFFAAFVSTAGFSVVANERLEGRHGIGGFELAAMAGLVLVALLFGREKRS